MEKHKNMIDENNLKSIRDSIDEMLAANEKPCKIGCDYCCHQFLPIFSFERSYLEAAIKKLHPKIKKKIKANFLKVHEHFIKNTPDVKEIKLIDALRNYGKKQAIDNIPCALLINHKCAIYEDRPLVCRWHFVADQPEKCASNRLRDAAPASQGFQNIFLAYLMKYNVDGTMESMLPILHELFDKNGKTKNILDDSLENE